MSPCVLYCKVKPSQATTMSAVSMEQSQHSAATTGSKQSSAIDASDSAVGIQVRAALYIFCNFGTSDVAICSTVFGLMRYINLRLN